MAATAQDSTAPLRGDAKYKEDDMEEGAFLFSSPFRRARLFGGPTRAAASQRRAW